MMKLLAVLLFLLAASCASVIQPAAFPYHPFGYYGPGWWGTYPLN